MTEDDIATLRIRNATWLSPVRVADQLPVDHVIEGAMCFVEGREGAGEEEVWTFTNGAWQRVDSL